MAHLTEEYKTVLWQQIH